MYHCAGVKKIYLQTMKKKKMVKTVMDVTMGLRKRGKRKKRGIWKMGKRMRKEGQIMKEGEGKMGKRIPIVKLVCETNKYIRVDDKNISKLFFLLLSCHVRRIFLIETKTTSITITIKII